MAGSTGILGSVKGALGGIISGVTGLLRLPTKKRVSPEPFAAVVDETPSADALLEPNVAVLRPKGKKAANVARVDVREVVTGIIRNKTLVIAISAVLVFFLILAITAVFVGAPAKPLPPAKPATREGAALVRRMVVPPASSLAPRMAMEREEAASYDLDEAVHLGLDGVDIGGLSSRNDVAAEELFRTVR